MSSKIPLPFYWWNQIPKTLPENVLCTVVAMELGLRGKANSQEVYTPAGIADIVTANAIYEVKLVLSRANLFKAIGQALIYRQSLNPALQAVVVGFEHPDERVELIARYAESFNLKLWRLTPQDFQVRSIQYLYLAYLNAIIQKQLTQWNEYAAQCKATYMLLMEKHISMERFYSLNEPFVQLMELLRDKLVPQIGEFLDICGECHAHPVVIHTCKANYFSVLKREDHFGDLGALASILSNLLEMVKSET